MAARQLHKGLANALRASWTTGARYSERSHRSRSSCHNIHTRHRSMNVSNSKRCSKLPCIIDPEYRAVQSLHNSLMNMSSGVGALQKALVAAHQPKYPPQVVFNPKTGAHKVERQTPWFLRCNAGIAARARQDRQSKGTRHLRRTDKANGTTW